MKAVSQLFKCNVYGNQSWGTPSGNLSTEHLILDWRCGYNIPVIQNWTKYTTKDRQEKVRPLKDYKEGYESAGKWTRCLYNNGNIKIEEIYNIPAK